MNKKDNEKNIMQRASHVLPQGSLGNLNYDLVIERGKGSHVWDESGNEYIDYLLGSGPMIIGHSHDEVTKATITQLQKGTTFFANNEKAIQLAEEIIRAVPCAEKVRFFSTGSEATLYAMRLARAYRKKDKILKFEGGFHGMNDYALMSMTPKKLYEFPRSEPDSPGIPKSVQSEVLVAPFNNIEITTSIIEQHHDEIGGVIVEPLQRLIPPVPGFLEGLREVTRRFEIPLIFDEIVTGFRLAYGGAQEYYNVTPDICTLGKAVAGGFPLTAVTGNEEIMGHFDSTSVLPEQHLLQVGTLSGNPVACAAGLATLSILRQNNTYQNLFNNGKKLMQGLQNSFDNSGTPAKIIGEPVLFDVFFTDHDVYDYRSGLNGNPELLSKFNQALLNRGVLKGATKFYVSTKHTNKDIENTMKIFDQISEILEY